MGKRCLVTLALTIAVFCLMSVPSFAVPEFINYEGKLADTAGYDVNGAYEMTFYMYDIEAGGTALWSEQQTVTITDGIFNAKLGITTSFPIGLFDNDNLYLEVTIRNPDTDAYEILSPRYHLASSGFAIKARDADTLDGMHASDLGTGDGHSLDGADGGPTDAVYVDDAGNVGIGTTSPVNKLETITVAGNNFDGITVRGHNDPYNYGINIEIPSNGQWNICSGGSGHGWGVGNLFIAEGRSKNRITIEKDTGNVGIGTTSPSGKLEVDGTVKAITFVGDGSQLTGITGSGQWTNTTGGICYNGGNVGIGTTSPVNKLETITIAGNNFDGITVRGHNDPYNYGINIEIPSNGQWNICSGGSGHGWGAGNLFIAEGRSKNRITIEKDTGNVGIGTTSPSAKLEVDGTVKATTFVGDGSQLTGISGSGQWTNSIGGIYYNSGNVGIGVTDPQAKLHITGGEVWFGNYLVTYPSTPSTGSGSLVGKGVTSDYRLAIQDGSGRVNQYWNAYYDLSAARHKYQVAVDAETHPEGANRFQMHSGTFVFQVAPGGTEGSDITWRTAIYGDNSGNVGIGTTNPQGTLDVNGAIYQRGVALHADYVFEPGYRLESINEHAEFMWKNKHLKAIPKATVDQNGQEMIEVGAHRKGIVEEVEKAHIYIEQLHKHILAVEERNKKMEERNKKMEKYNKKIEERLAKLEAMLPNNTQQ